MPGAQAAQEMIRRTVKAIEESEAVLTRTKVLLRKVALREKEALYKTARRIETGSRTTIP